MALNIEKRGANTVKWRTGGGYAPVSTLKFPFQSSFSWLKSGYPFFETRPGSGIGKGAANKGPIILMALLFCGSGVRKKKKKKKNFVHHMALVTITAREVWAFPYSVSSSISFVMPCAN